MGENRTIGETVDMAFARAEAEMRSGRQGCLGGLQAQEKAKINV